MMLAGTDPCFDASQTCHEHADCVPADQSFRCVCRAGYRGNGMDCQGNCFVFSMIQNVYISELITILAIGAILTNVQKQVIICPTGYNQNKCFWYLCSLGVWVFWFVSSRWQFSIYSRVAGYSFSSQICLLFQRKIISDTIWISFIVTVNIKPKNMIIQP